MFYLDNAFILEMSERCGTSTEDAEKTVIDYALRGRNDVTPCYLKVFMDEMRDALEKSPQEKTAETAKGFMIENKDAVKRIIAGWILSRNGDGRLYNKVVGWAQGVATDPMYGCPLHSCHLNKVALDLFVNPEGNNRGF